jgi:hypothetical protein
MKIALRGGAADDHSISIDTLAEVLKKVQLCVKRIGLTLIGQSAENKPGRIKGIVEAACSLDVIALMPGSFEVALALPVDKEAAPMLLDPGEPLGMRAVDKFVEGVALLGEDDPKLVQEFDYGVLTSLRDAAKPLGRGYQEIGFISMRKGARPRLATLDERVASRVSENISGPIKSAVQVNGTLREVDLEKRSCRIYPPQGRYVQCNFTAEHFSLMKEFLDTAVTASGEATLREADGRIKELRIDDIDQQSLEPLPLFEQTCAKPKTGKELLAALQESGLVGLWRGRKDIKDSSAFARQLRRKANARAKE